MKNRLFSAVILLATVFFTTEIPAGQKTFTAASGTWSTASNWSPAGVPAAGDTVTISNGSTCIVSTTSTCAALFLSSGTASTLTVNNNRTLTVSGSVRIKNSLTVGGSAGGSLTVNGKFIVDSTGVFTKTNGHMTVNDTAFIYGSIVFTSTSGTKIFSRIVVANSGVWNNSANESFTLRRGLTNYGTFTSGTGGYTFSNYNQSLDGNAITFAGSITVSNGRTVTNNTVLTITGNLTGGGTSAVFVNAAGAVLNVNGTVMATGTLTANANGNTVNYCRAGAQTLERTVYYNLILSGSGTKTTTGVTVNGKLSRQGTATASALPSYGAAAVLEYKGSAAQTTGVEFPASMNNQVIIDNSNGVTLNSARTLNNSLILISGYLTTTAANLLTIGAAGSIAGGSSISFVNGPLARIKNTAAQQTLLFPLGKNSAYRPIELIIQHTNATSSTYRAELFNTAPVGRTLPSSISGISTVRYWNITKTGGAVVSSAFVALHYDADDGVADPENLRVVKDNGTDWQDLGGTANGSPAGSILSGSFTTFSDFVLANASGGSNPLPVELSSFIARSKDQEVLLSWTTQTEVENYGFEVERRSEEKNWERVGFVEGHGNSNSPKEYSYSEKLLSPGKYFYRLKQIDADGNYKYSSKLEITVSQVPGSFLLAQNYPNPFNPVTTIKFSVAENIPALIKVYDVIGNEVVTLFNETAQAGRIYEVIFNGSEYSSGIYFYSISTGKFNAVKKMTLIK